ncbi:piggyBac transposable element-derived protein 1-like [Schistocerca gregaria]|uniref:piggyBac transposable element-derived protein 1-like n=1 Tax=Schistocerca gregaria TaxID=7010 RepID=UPI00211DAA40|nr:piggyBac transposable element-derived protein 1-like [Schistocerca gregaria]
MPHWQGSIPESTSIQELVEYFKHFFDIQLLKHITEQTNLYCVQKNLAKPFQLTVSELYQYIGTAFYMALVSVPCTQLCWSPSFSVPCLSGVMSRERWEDIKSNLHFNDTTKVPDVGANKDTLFKLRPLINSLLKKFNNLPIDRMLCVDEQMVPFKGMSSFIQYMPNKPHKCGYKLYIVCVWKGIVYISEVYCGKHYPLPECKDLGANANVILYLCKVIPRQQNHLLYFDNWFTTIPLLLKLAHMKIFWLWTVRANRFPSRVVATDKDLGKKRKGELLMTVCEALNIVVISTCTRSESFQSILGIF